MKLVFVHVSGSKKGKVDVFTKQKIRIGADPSCDLCFDKVENENISTFHAEIICKNNVYVIKDLDSKNGTFVNDKLVDSLNLKDGDLVSFGLGGPQIRLRILNVKEGIFSDKRVLKVFRALGISVNLTRELTESDKVRKSGVYGEKGYINSAVKGLSIFIEDVRKLSFLRLSNPSRFFIFVLLLFIIGGSLSFLLYYFNKLEETSVRVRKLETQQSDIENVIEKYRKGVCFIQGNFYIVDIKTGEPIRTTPNGEPLTSDFTGSGFLVDPKGIILSNRHVADPLWKGFVSSDETSIQHKEPTRKVVFVKLIAFFPDVEEPFPLEIVKISEDADVAVFKFTPPDFELPVLKLDPLYYYNVRRGEPVILLGYPAGINAILGKADQKVVDEMINLSPLEIARKLSTLKLIRPLITQGHVSDLAIDKIIYDAQTTFGGSGGPLINKNGDVIGINYGILRAFTGSNFAVPIKYGIKILEE